MVSKTRLPKPPMTGWPAGLLQDDCRKLSKWLANTPGARHQVRDNLKRRNEMQENLTPADVLESHLDAYWSLAYDEGRYGTSHGTEANVRLSAIKTLFVAKDAEMEAAGWVRKQMFVPAPTSPLDPLRFIRRALVLADRLPDGDLAYTLRLYLNNPVCAVNLEMLEALKGVVRVADRTTQEFDAARAAIAAAEALLVVKTDPGMF